MTSNANPDEPDLPVESQPAAEPPQVQPTRPTLVRRFRGRAASQQPSPQEDSQTQVDASNQPNAKEDDHKPIDEPQDKPVRSTKVRSIE